MKHLLVLLLAVTALSACNEHKGPSNTAPATGTSDVSTEEQPEVRTE